MRVGKTLYALDARCNCARWDGNRTSQVVTTERRSIRSPMGSIWNGIRVRPFVDHGGWFGLPGRWTLALALGNDEI